MARFPSASLIVASILGVGLLGTIAMAAEEKLKVGDPAPPLTVSTWLHGAEVKKFEPGRVYVVEFWATWCGPCRQIMPHMGDLQDEYRDKGVTFIGFASEANDKEAKVNAFVARQGAKLGYTFAFESASETHTAYMKASGQNGIPCSFVVDKQGRIAYIGHPLFLDFVLPKVLDGTWDQKAGADTLAAADKDFDAAYAVTMTPTNSAEAGLEALAKFAAKWPTLANNVYMIQSKLGLLVRAKQFPAAKELAQKLIAKAVVRGDTSGLRSVSTALRNDSTKGHGDLTALAIRAAEAAYDLDQENPTTLRDLVEAYAFAGDQAKVKEFGPRAISAAKAAVQGENDAIGTLAVAAAYFASGDEVQAKATAEKAVKMVERVKNAGLLRYVEQQAKKYGRSPRSTIRRATTNLSGKQSRSSAGTTFACAARGIVVEMSGSFRRDEMRSHPARGDVPEEDRAGAVDAGQQVAVRRECDGLDLVPMPGQLRLRLREELLPQVPAAQADLSRLRLGHQTTEPRFGHQSDLEDLARCGLANRIRVVVEPGERHLQASPLGRVALPEHRRDQPDPTTIPADYQHVPRRRIREPIHTAAVLQPPARRSGLGVPRAHGSVPAAGDHAPAVGREEAGVDQGTIVL